MKNEETGSWQVGLSRASFINSAIKEYRNIFIMSLKIILFLHTILIVIQDIFWKLFLDVFFGM